MSLFMPCSLRGLLLCFRRTDAADHKPAGVVYLATQHTHFPGCWVRLFPLLPRALYIVFQLSSLARSPAHISFSLLFVFSVCTEGWFAAPQSSPPICDSFSSSLQKLGLPNLERKGAFVQAWDSTRYPKGHSSFIINGFWSATHCCLGVILEAKHHPCPVGLMRQRKEIMVTANWHAWLHRTFLGNTRLEHSFSTSWF